MIVITTPEVSKQIGAYGVTQKAIHDAVLKAERGLKVADLGDGLIKLRIARGNRGPSHGCRGIFIKHSSDIFLFVDLFAKNEKENLTAAELAAFVDLAPLYINMRSAALMRLAVSKSWDFENI